MTKIFNRSLLVVAILFSISPVSLAQLQLPQPTGMVSDFAAKLSPATKQSLETLLMNFRDRSNGIEVAVVTIPFDDMQGYPIEDYALQLGRQWGIGRGSEKNGLLLLIAIKPPNNQGIYSGNTRLEVSRHLEGDIPDGLAGYLIRQMRDPFRAGQFDQAVSNGVQTILATVAQKRGISMEGIDQTRAYRAPQQQPRRSRGGLSPLIMIILIIVVFAIISSLGKGGGGGRGGRRRGRRGGSDWMLWPIIFGGGGSGGFGGFGGSSSGGSSWGGGDGGGFGGFGGGGDFGGGGASDSW